MDNDISKQLEYLTSLLDDPESNKGKILYCISSLYSASMTQETIDLLNKSASLVMSADLISILKGLYIEEYCALFASKRLLEIEDVKEDLLNGDVIKTSSIPAIVVNKLKSKVSVDASLNTKQDNGEKLDLKTKTTESQSTKIQLKEYLEELCASDPQMSPEVALEKVKQKFSNIELPDEKITKKFTSLKSKQEKGAKKPKEPKEKKTKEPKEEKKKSKEPKDIK